MRILTNICTDNLTKSKDFYVALLGFHVKYDSDWYVQLCSPEDSEIEYGIIQRNHELVPDEYRKAPTGMYVTFVVDDVDAIYNKALELNNQSSEAHNNLANLFSFLNNPEAEFHYKKTIELIPNEIYPRLNFSNYLIKSNKFSESLKYLKELIDMGFESKEVYNSLGVSYKGLNDDESASKMFHKSLEIDPGFALAQKNLESLN